MVANFSVPPKMPLPISRGGDLIVDFKQKINDVYTDYAPEVSVRIEIDVQDKGTPTPPVQTFVGEGVVASFHAVCRIESQVADLVPNGSLWRCIVSYPTSPSTTEVVAINGRVTRLDGA